jgi:hypothetical protein
LDPTIDPTAHNKGKWTQEEDAKLTDAVKKHGNNWAPVAALVPGRTKLHCSQTWVQRLHPDINASKWTVEEDAKLTDAVTKHGAGNWAAVAALVPGRTNKQCRKRWVESLNPAINTGTWTVEDDTKLTEAVTEFGNDWVRVSVLVPGRTNRQCAQRWVRSVDPTINAGRWTVEEDVKLTDAVTKHGSNWAPVAALVPGRTKIQCSQRWEHSLNPDINTVTWAVEDDTKLAEAVTKFGNDWVRVSVLVPGRTNRQCRHRWMKHMD